MDTTERGTLLELFVSGLPHYAVSLVDPDGKVLSWNAGAREIHGYAADEIIGRHFSCLSTKEDIASAKPLQSLANALAHGRCDELGRRVRKDGTEFEAQTILMPLRDSAKRLLGFGCLTRPIAGSLPAVADNTNEPAVALAPPPAREKILLVDDDDSVRDAAMQQLTSLGYRVIAASNGTEALDLLSRNLDVDLLFTDVIMPGGMNGGEVAEAARSVRPGLKVLFASGYFEGALVREGNIEASAQFIVKPYRKKELALKMEEVLGAKALVR
jgi:PAS domain S-box-containing protein